MRGESQPAMHCLQVQPYKVFVADMVGEHMR